MNRDYIFIISTIMNGEYTFSIKVNCTILFTVSIFQHYVKLKLRRSLTWVEKIINSMLMYNYWKIIHIRSEFNEHLKENLDSLKTKLNNCNRIRTRFCFTLAALYIFLPMILFQIAWSSHQREWNCYLRLSGGIARKQKSKSQRYQSNIFHGKAYIYSQFLSATRYLSYGV